MSSLPVTLTEGVTGTLVVYGSMHNAFVSAIPTPSTVRGSTDKNLPINKKRFLREFIEKYKQAVSSSLTLHTPNAVREMINSSAFKKYGDAILFFAEKWNAYILACIEEKLPTEFDVSQLKKEFVEIAKLGYGEHDAAGRTKLITRLNALAKTSWYLRVPLLSMPDALGGILGSATSTNNRYGNHMYPGRYDSATTTFAINLTDVEIKAMLDKSQQVVETSVTRSLDPEIATWKDFATLAPERLEGNPEFAGEQFLQAKHAATELLSSLTGLYAQTHLPKALTTFLEDAAALADKFGKDLGRTGASAVELQHSETLIAYATALKVLADQVTTFVKTVEVTPDTLPLTFLAQFPSARNLSDIGVKLASTWGGKDSSMATSWLRAPSAAFSVDGYRPTTEAAAAGTLGAAGTVGFVPGSTGGGLSRVIDKDRVKECLALVTKFRASLDETDMKSVARLMENTKTSLTQFSEKVRELKDQDNATGLDGLRDQQARAIKSFLSRARGVMSRHRNRHVMFALQFNRGPLRYMTYWKTCGIPAMQALTRDYFEKLAEVTAAGHSELDGMHKSVNSLMQDGVTYTGLNDRDIESIVETFERIRGFRQTCKDRIAAVHSRPSTFLDQLASDTHVHVIYVLKVVRFLMAWMSLSIATRAFSSVYASNVYIKNVDPPPPTLFLAMFFGVDIAMNAGLMTALWAASRVFKSPSNDFPIDGYLLSSWSVDVACSEIVMVGISFAFGNIISTKKAFRYRQEGDRGIRALGQMMLYSYAVILLIPFFRIV